MKAFTLFSLVFLSSFVIGCASNNQKSLLEERAGYGVTPPNVTLTGSGPVKYVPTRIPETVIVPWLHAKELPSKDYFWGAWLSVVVKPETWETRKVEIPKSEKKKSTQRTPEKPQQSRPKAKP